MKKKTSILFAAAGSALLITSSMAATWTGGTNASWATADNWTGPAPDNVTAQAISFDATSTANLTQTLDASYSVTGITLTSPTGPVIVNTGTGTNVLTIGASGIDLSTASQNLTINGSNVTLGAAQSWNVGSGRSLNVGSSGGIITLSNKLTTTGAGTFTLGGSGATTLTGAGDLEINGGGFTNNMQAGSSSAGRTGATTLTSGTLAISTSISMFGSGALNLNGGAIGSGTVTGRTISNDVNIGGDVRFGGGELKSGNITVSGPISLGGATRQIDARSTGTLGTLFSGKISNGGITLNGASNGILTLSNDTNDYTGATTITSGQLAISTGAVANSTSLSLASGTRLFIGNNGTTKINNLSGAATSSIRTDFNISTGNGNRDIEVTQTTDGTYAGTFTEGGSRPISLTKKGGASLTLSGTGGYSGITNVDAGTLVIDGSNSAGTGAMTVKSSATLAGIGTVGGATTIQADGIHAPGNSPGVQKFASSLTYSDASIFSWEIDHTKTQTRGTGYDGVNVVGTLAGLDGADVGTTTDAIFRIVIGDSDFSDAFWSTSKTWEDIFTAADGSTAKTNWASIFNDGNFQYYNTNGSVISAPVTGSFAMSGNTLTWTAVPEPTSALAGLLLSAGLLRRRRA